MVVIKDGTASCANNGQSLTIAPDWRRNGCHESYHSSESAIPSHPAHQEADLFSHPSERRTSMPKKEPKKVRGVFERPKGSGTWWIRYADEFGVIHREKVG